jgi:hypothetical protein
MMNMSPTSSVQTQADHSEESPRAAITVIAALIGLGALTGAIVTFLVLGLGAVLAQLGHPTSQSFLQLVFNIFRRMSDVLVVWFQAPMDGALTGMFTGAAVGLVYLATLWIDRTHGFFAQRPLLYFGALALGGAAGAAVGARGVLLDVRYWAALAGALYGLGAAYAITQSRSERSR